MFSSFVIGLFIRSLGGSWRAIVLPGRSCPMFRTYWRLIAFQVGKDCIHHLVHHLVKISDRLLSSLCLHSPGKGDLTTSWKPVLFLPCFTGIELASGPCDPYVAPVLPSEAEETMHQMLQNLPTLSAHLCKYATRLELSTSGKSGRPRGQDTVLYTSLYSGHVSSLFSYVHMKLMVS